MNETKKKTLRGVSKRRVAVFTNQREKNENT